MKILNKKIGTSLIALCLLIGLVVIGCSKKELLLPEYENIAVEGFDNLVLTGRQNSILAQWDRLAQKDVDYVLVRYMDDTADGKSVQTRRYARDREEIIIYNLQNFKEYELTFMVVDNYGNTSDSIVAKATPIAEIVNVFVAGGDTEGSVDIIWEDPEDPFEVFSAVFFYDEEGNLLGSADRGEQQITLTGLTPGEEIVIRAKVKLGDGFSEGIDIVASPRVILPPPGEVIDLVVKGKTNHLELTWENPTDESFAFVEVYFGAGSVESDATTRFMGQPETIAGNRMKVLIPNLVNGTQYVALIKTSDIHGNVSTGIVAFGTPKNTVHEGNLVIGTQQDVDAFNEDITYIKGNLTISSSVLTSGFDKLSNLDSISGNLLYAAASGSTGIFEFPNLQKVGGMIEVNGFYVDGALNFPQLKLVGGNFRVRYFNVHTISAPLLERVGTTTSNEMYFFGAANNLTTLNFPSLQRIEGRFLLGRLSAITNLDGFSALNHVGGNFIIGHGAFSNQEDASYGCASLTNLCGIRSLMQSGYIGGSVTLVNFTAPFAPTQAGIAAGNCSN